MQELTVKVETATLTGRIQENRDQHKSVFLEAMEGFRRAVEAQLQDRIERIRKGKQIEMTIRLPVPVDHTEDMHTEGTIEISNDEFAMYVRDDWTWKREFAATSALYNG